MSQIETLLEGEKMAQLNKTNLMPGLFGEPTADKDKKGHNENLVVNIEKLLDFHSEIINGKAHPFRRLSGTKLEELKDSINENGLLYPIKIRKDPQYEGFYEIIAGHNRRDVLKSLGRTELYESKGEIELIEADDEKAINQMIATNIQRDEIFVMDKAWAYRIWLENNKNIRSHGIRNDQKLADETGDSRANIQRYVRLTYLIEPLQNLIDTKALPLNVGVELSWTDYKQQEAIHEYICSKSKITLDQAHKIKELAQERFLSVEDLQALFDIEKKTAPLNDVFKNTSRYFKKYDISKADKINAADLEELIKNTVEHYLESL